MEGSSFIGSGVSSQKQAFNTESAGPLSDRRYSHETDERKMPNKVILVDDDADIAERICAHLKLINAECIWITNPAQLESMLSCEPNLIIMNIQFPEESTLGLKTVKILKDKQAIHCPVVFLSEEESFATRLNAVQIGCSAFFIKPINPIEFRFAIQDQLKSKQEKSFHVLIIDDEPIFTQMTGRLLSIAEITFTALHDPTDALEYIETTNPDVILLDINMPKCHGFELAKVIRQHQKYTHIPIMFLSSHDSSDRKVEAERAFADGFYSKGQDPRHLIESIKSKAIRSRESQKLTRRLRRSESHFKNVAETAGDAILSVDKNGRIILWNGGAKRIFGYSEREMLGEPLITIIPEEHRKEHVGGFTNACMNESYMPFCGLVNINALHKDGYVFPIEMSLSKNGQGDDVYFTAILRDVTERIQIQQSILDSKQRFRDIAETATDWFWEMGPDLRFTYDSSNFDPRINKGNKSSIGKTRLEHYGIDLETLPPEEHQKWLQHLETLKKRNPFKGFEHAIKLETGEEISLRVSGIPFFDNEGNFMGYRGATTDITELKLSERQLIQRVEEATSELHEKTRLIEEALEKEKELNTLQRQFVSMASHEFRTPLSIIDLTAQRISRSIDTKPKEYILDKVDKIRRSVVRLTGLIDSTLSADKMESGKTLFNPSRANIMDILTSVCNGHGEVAPGHKINLYYEHENLTLNADASLIEQVFMNLISNAIKYSPDGGPIDVSVCQREDHVDISFKDYGVGIPEDEQNNLFQRFFRSRTSSGIVGTGLGLYLVQQFVKLHGGHISVFSREGEGATFTVSLPTSLDISSPNHMEYEGNDNGDHPVH